MERKTGGGRGPRKENPRRASLAEANSETSMLKGCTRSQTAFFFWEKGGSWELIIPVIETLRAQRRGTRQSFG